MDIHELNRAKRNEKVKSYADKILADCESKQFSVADMKDLAEILPTRISKAIIIIEESAVFSNLSQ